MQKISIFWFRRDLRLEDNHALHLANSSKQQVLPIFIFDPNILNRFEDKYDRRVHYIHQALEKLQLELKQVNSGILFFHKNPLDVFKELIVSYDIDSVFCNKDYEPSSIKRDLEIRNFLKSQNIHFISVKDQVVFEENEIIKEDQSPYTVYTPYSKKWKKKLQNSDYKEYVTLNNNWLEHSAYPIPLLKDIGFSETDLLFQKPDLRVEIIRDYDKFRDYPAKKHTSELGIALRFGTISIRKCISFALLHNEVWLNELIWREFFMQILFHFPDVVDRCFKSKYESIPWRNNIQEFKKWCDGETGYPIVDAGMKQLNTTGQMHNRVRMIVAGFLTKHLLIDWRWGEAYFAQKLLDYDLSANNGNWQWAAGCGCDAAPYFRIFNPTEQVKKFDKNLEYIRKWNPDFDTKLTPPIVDHKFARERALKVYKMALENQ